MNERPLEEAKRCAAMVVERLRPTDRVAIITYDGEVDAVVPCSPATSNPSSRSSVLRIARWAAHAPFGLLVRWRREKGS
jgi:Ca-activated chloride channel homolog